ncbi:MAG TPA: bifunctional DNA-formamidopyrimidine glycosylase/DNA-(apurinic or apyrimidinic site) lyase [Gammaproteobacteria bacterium]|nr:bifunctional DNA-formamidopyrimidine glycosylase/DNA-(apurinic or apyrimidinic site) lyase [Gammaproteobacteria bacterium]
MPELPEVETTKAGITPAALNQTISEIIIRAPKLRWPIPKNIAKNLPGQIVRSIERRAKYLLLNFDTGTLILHLGMSGRLRVLTEATPAQKHDHVDICFTSGSILRYTDPRRFGAILWTPEPALEHKLLVDLGPEPFDAEFTGKFLLERAKNKKIAIKLFIMDSKVVVGVGNIYASEALFAAKIDPRKPAQQVTLDQYNELAKHIKRILKAAIAKGGTTLRDFYTTTGEPGYFSQKLQVYGRDKEPCFICNAPIESVTLGQRNTFFCSNCQS